MVILVAVGLAFTSQALKTRQKDNENIDKMQQLLSSIHIDATANNAVELYNKHITDAFLVDYNGNKVEGSEGVKETDPAFQTDFSKAIRDKEEGQYPVYIAEVDGSKKYIFGMSGAGLWGPIWGYISINDDGSTIYGVDFSHQGETPGLGAEITKPWFKERFDNKHIFMDDVYSPVVVEKRGSQLPNGVDAISGSTLTSNGVNDMIRNSMKVYEQFLLNNN